MMRAAITTAYWLSWFASHSAWAQDVPLYDTNSAARWQSAVARAQALTAQMTLEELNNVTYGGAGSACAGLSGSVPRLGFEGLCYNDIGKTDLVNSYATGISIGASWNLQLAHERGRFMGAEWRKKGVKVGLTPVVGPIGRTALGGRNMEGFGADPYLAGKFSAATITGLQESVVASVKHYIANEQETFRKPGPLNNFSVSSNVNDKDMHELYLWPFQDSVRAGVGSVMCSYQRINETYGCENSETQNTLLKGELNFPGFVVSDWGAQLSGLESAIGGMDVAMPISTYWMNGTLAQAVRNGSMPESRLRDMAARQLAASFYVFDGATSEPPNGYGLAADYLAARQLIDARDPASKPSILQQAVEGHVLVKNIKNALPLKHPKILSLFGYDAKVQPLNNPSSGVLSLVWSWAVQSVNAQLSTLAEVLTGVPVQLPQIYENGTLYTATGSGSSIAGYISDPYSAISQRAYEDDIYLWWDFTSYAPDVSAASSACLVFLNDLSTESCDRSGLADPQSDQLVLHVASRCNNTIVVIHNPFIRILDAFYDHPNVTAIMLAHIPGQDSGRALVKVLFGDVSPSGRLPYTIAKQASDYGPLLNASYVPAGNPQVDLSDPSLFDYRYFQANNITPRIPFGYGMSYTTFAYREARIVYDLFTSAPANPPNPQDRIPGGVRSLFETLIKAEVDISNTGEVTAAEVAQVYVQFPGEDISVLRGFEKRVIHPGAMETFTIELDRRDLSRWDVASQQWVLPTGTLRVLFGPNSADLLGNIDLSR